MRRPCGHPRRDPASAAESERQLFHDEKDEADENARSDADKNIASARCCTEWNGDEDDDQANPWRSQARLQNGAQRGGLLTLKPRMQLQVIENFPGRKLCLAERTQAFDIVDLDLAF